MPPTSDNPDPAAQPVGEGVIYSGTGSFYIGEAIASARSSMRHNALAHLLFASEPVADAQGLEVALFEPSGNPYVDKIANMRRSPFERTLYLDSDTFVVDEIGHVLQLLDNYDLAVAFAPAYRRLEDPEVPAAFYEFNTGVLAWRSSERVATFMRSWEETYKAWLQEEPFPGGGRASRGRRADQPSFRRCAWQHQLRLFVLAPEYNFRLGYPATVVERVHVIHGDHPDHAGLAARLNERSGPRSWPPPLSLAAKVKRRLRRPAKPAETPRTAPLPNAGARGED